MKRVLFFLYGILAYFVALATVLYAVGFLGNTFILHSLDAEPVMPVVPALLINGGLIFLVILQYNMLRSSILRRWWGRLVPEPIGRSSFVLLASLNFFLLMWQWQPIGGVIWQIDNHIATTVLRIINLIGWSVIMVSSFLIQHFDFLGVRQTWMNLRNKPYQNLPFRDPMFYQLARHPLQAGLLIVLWSTSVMTVTHLFFTLLTAAYVYTSIQLEERTNYRKRNRRSINAKVIQFK